MADGGFNRQVEPSDLGIGHLFEQTTDAIVVADEAGAIVLWNPAAERVFGYTRAEAPGMNVDRLIPPELRAQHHAGMRRFREHHTGPRIESREPFEVPAVRKDGTHIFIEMTLNRLPGDAHHALAIIRDVTERVRLTESLRDERARLRHVNESLEAFAYIIGHDLKEPVRAVNALLKVVEESTDAAERDDALQRAVRANDAMARLLRGLLEWSQASTLPVVRRTVHIQDVLGSEPCEVQYRKLAHDRDARIDVAPDIPPVDGHGPLLCQVFGNLITNALRHNPEPTPRVRIYHVPSEDPLSVEVVVEDNGEGLPDDVAERLSTTSPARPRTLHGGFGLAIVQRATARLGGTLGVSRAPEGGARIHVRLPRAGP